MRYILHYNFINGLYYVWDTDGGFLTASYADVNTAHDVLDALNGEFSLNGLVTA